ncbi:YjbH domain-containing protein [Pseudaeromonas sp. ZJS20]|uniref:YjbH domain-containing protein n=1 Tax=Pseudaeromonas aegiceratis TaxID=3153928 RepID=UPI00390C91A5
MMFRMSLVALACCTAFTAQADDYNPRLDGIGPSQGDFGGVGLLQMPTARMARTGEFSVNYMDNEQYRRWSTSIQVFDWLETTLRYTDVRTRLYSSHPDFSGDQTYKDKGIDFKLRLWQESHWLPQVALGVRDFAGTGLFDSEFLVASKAWGPLDFTLGMGWGNMAESGNIKNAFCSAADKFCQRSGFDGIPGDFEFGNLFHGPAALFGGIEYQTPWQPLRLKLEYDGNDYSNETAGTIKQDSPINVGAVYRLFESVDTHLSYQRGNTWMWGVTLRTNFNDLTQNHLDEPRPKSAPGNTNGADSQALMTSLQHNAGFKQARLYQDGDSRLILEGEQGKYRDKVEGEQRAVTLLANQLPVPAEQYRIVYTKNGLPVDEAVIDAKQWQAQQAGEVLGQPKAETTQRANAGSPQGNLLADNTQRLTYSWKPQLQQSFGGPESFYLYQFGINGNGDFKFTDNLSLGGTLYWNWFDNLDKFNYTTPPSNTDALPRVRTWIREYVSSSDLLLTNLQLTAMGRLAPDWYAQVYAGYLEMMYAGVGSEVLYRPYGKSWALGANGNYVRQRDWNNTMRLADYKTFTGHATLYWQLPYLDQSLAKISVGQYLAKDKGVTIDLSRRFDSGIVAGAYATFTDVTAEEYGEGSFTKGFYITIPFDLLLVRPTTGVGTIGWTPLTRDGGQMLSRHYSMYEISDNE